MLVNGKEISIDELVSEIGIDSHIMYNGIYLSKSQINILESNGFDYKKYNNIKELIFDLDEYLSNEPDNLELENVLDELSEFDYYHNVNK